MFELKADLWEVETEARCITTNGIVRKNGEAVMGKGCAAQAKSRYPQVPKVLGDYLDRFGNHVHLLLDRPTALISFPTKLDWKNPSDLRLIVRSAHELVTLTNEFCWLKVVLPRPGVGLGGLSWIDVGALLRTILDNRFVVVSQ